MRRKGTTILLNAPYTVWATIFIVVPLFIVSYYAFTDNNGAFTLENIKNLVNYTDIFLISILYSLVATLITIIIGYPFAYAMTKKKRFFTEDADDARYASYVDELTYPYVFVA